jgi:transcriptional regulator with XRE-family HTH domain
MPDEPATEFDRALGTELRAIRERLDLTREQAVARMEQIAGVEIGDRTLLTYEHGIRRLTVARLYELSQTYGVPVTLILADALRRMSADVACPTCGREP